MNNIKRIVLTGGPCAGKTTALVRIVEHFSSLGFKVFTVPEVPTMYSQGGWSYLTPNRKLYYEGELAILETQLALEDSFMRLAETCTKPAFVVCDRGTMDISAYIAPEMWDDITSKCGTNTNQLRERYDAVLHLVSAADGAEQYYTVANNANRYEQANEEGLQLARDLDKKVNRAWTGHPHLRVINNHDVFDAKLRRVIQEISNVLGLPQPVTEERMYIIELTGELPECIESEITQTYLVGEPDCEIRLRRRDWGGEVVNVHKTKKGRPLSLGYPQDPPLFHLEGPVFRNRLLPCSRRPSHDTADQGRCRAGGCQLSALHQGGQGHHGKQRVL